MNKVYRTDIDGLRAIAVTSVILFHLGYITNGYLGVDIFFVISGYLITGIVYNEVVNDKFSVLKFYERRIRRILPLVLFVTFISFLLGITFMLPDDLENLCQSIIASNFSINNILMKITSADYWAVKNDYKPLMHTWSLGIEEQFYLLYPFLFFFLSGSRKRFIFISLIGLTLVSLALFLYENNTASKFYFLQYRFFELSIGGLCAIYFLKNQFTSILKSQPALIAILIVIILLLFSNVIKSNDINIVLITILTASVLVLGNIQFEVNKIYKFLITNQVITFIGKISFSLYMWHQVVFAFSRYLLLEEISIENSIVLSFLVFLLSVLTYFLVENPFRNKQFIKIKLLLLIITFSFILINGASFYVYAVGGIIKDIPELGIKKSEGPKQINFFSSQANINIQYNEDIRKLDKAFSSEGKIKVLVVGDSYARDFANILIESTFCEKLEISYLYATSNNDENKLRFQNADYIFYATNAPSIKKNVAESFKNIDYDINKLWIVGTKDFGNSNGIYYNRKNKSQNCEIYRTTMKKGVLETNTILKNEWQHKYINLISYIIDDNNEVLVFTPDCKFISQDTKHLTRHGAKFFSQLLNQELSKTFKI
jgi:peptidoglycan/LPS O-acetylase OafA/YrhL